MRLIELLLIGLVCWPQAAKAQLGPCTIETVAGGGTLARGDGGPALEAELFLPSEAVVGPDGLLYIADDGHNRIRRISADGAIETFAGTGALEFSGDGVPALQAGIVRPRSLTFAPNGSLYFLDTGRLRVRNAPTVLRRIDPNGIIHTIAGESSTVHSGDGGPAVDAGLGRSTQRVSIAAGPDGSIYVSGGHRIRRITPDGMIRTIAGISDPNGRGNPTSGDGGPAIEAGLSDPGDVTVDSQGVIYFVEGQHIGRRILADSTIESYFFPAQTRQFVPVETDSQDRLHWLEIRKVQRMSAEGQVETVWEGDLAPQRFSIAPDGRIFAALGHRVFELHDGNQATPVAGAETDPTFGDGGPAREATLSPSAIAVGASGELYIGSSVLGRIRLVRDGVVERFAGSGSRLFRINEGSALDANFDQIFDLEAGHDGDLYVAGRNIVYRIDPQGMIAPYAGDGAFQCERGGQCGDGGPATEAQVPRIRRLKATPDGALYILNHDRRRLPSRPQWVRRVGPDGVIESLPRPENFMAGALGLDGGQPIVWTSRTRRTLFRIAEDGSLSDPLEVPGVFFPGSVAGDGAGNLALPSGRGVTRVSPEGNVVTLARHRLEGPSFGGDGGPVAGAAIGPGVRDLTYDSAGNLYFIDGRRVRRINRPAECAAPRLPYPVAAGNAASGQPTSAPGTIVSIFGVELSGGDPVGAEVGPDGRLTTQLGATRAFLDGVPMPLTFASERQLNGIVPYATGTTGSLKGFAPSLIFVPETVAELVVEVNGVRSEPIAVSISAASPELFEQGNNLAAALNQDGSLNGGVNPAPPGSVVVLFGTGEGLTDPPGVDGLIASATLPRPVAEVEVLIAGEPVDVLYFGAAPGLVAGVFQANIRIPPDFERVGALPVTVRVGEYRNGPDGFRPSIVIGR